MIICVPDIPGKTVRNIRTVSGGGQIPGINWYLSPFWLFKPGNKCVGRGSVFRPVSEWPQHGLKEIKARESEGMLLTRDDH